MQPLRTGKPCGTKHKAICIPFHSRFQVEWFVKWTCEKICAEVCQFKMTGKLMGLGGGGSEGVPPGSHD